jgi:hypothetical protein
MKNLILFFFLSLPTMIFSQNTSVKPDARLYDALEKTYIDSLVKVNSNLINYYNYYLDNAYFIADDEKSDKKVGEVPLSVKVADVNNINILKLEHEQGLKPQLYFTTIYKIEGTQKYLCYYSSEVFKEHVEQYYRELLSGKKN